MATAAKKTASRPRKTLAEETKPRHKEQPAMSLPQPKSSDPIKTSSIPPAKTPTVEEAAKALGESLVSVIVPKAYRFTDDSHVVFDYDASTTKMPPTHANHWFSKAMGVKVRD